MKPSSTPLGWIALLSGLLLLVLAIRLSGPPDLEAFSQGRNIGYALDLIHRGNWLIQYDLAGRILSKPPLHTWLIGLLALPFGLNRVTMALPSFFAVAGLTLVVFGIGRRRFGLVEGGMAGLAVILAPILWKHVGLIRSDAVFSLLIAGGAWGAFKAWETGRGWTLFWVCGALSTLTKGPLGLLLSAMGLLACVWERKGNPSSPLPRGSHTAGILLFILICMSWIIPAVFLHPRELIDKMIYGELLGHIASEGAPHGGLWNRIGHFFEPSRDLISRFAPFSLAAIWGICQVFRNPAGDPGERRFERFLTCWFLGGLLLFSLASHQRTDLLLPLWPAAALLAGRQMARLASCAKPATSGWVTGLVCAGMLAAAWLSYHPMTAGAKERFVESEMVREAAAAFKATGADPRAIRYLNAPPSFQYYLGTASIAETPDDILFARDLGAKHILVATREDPINPADFGMAGVEEVFRWPADKTAAPVIRIFQLTWNDG